MAEKQLDASSPQGPAEARIPAGERIGPYVVLGFLGAGGMGEVYKARDTRLDRSVAIKFLPQSVAGDATALERFQREARAASALNHPGICTIHDVGTHNARPYLVLEYLEGQTLRSRLAGGSVPLPQVLDFGAQICDALNAAHARGIIHRDIKPANIFVTSREQIKILDFGLAKLAGDRYTATPNALAPDAQTTVDLTLTRPGSLLGTLAYLSPEQARGEEADARSDLFSLGVVLYETATGQRAFRADSSVELLHAILCETPSRPSVVNPSLPRELEAVILRCLEKNPEARYQSAADVHSDLRRLLQRTNVRVSRVVAQLAWAAACIVATLVVASIIMFRKSADHRVPDIVQRQMTANAVLDSVYTAAISDDGKEIAYADLRGIHIRVVETGEVRHISLPAGFCFR